MFLHAGIFTTTAARCTCRTEEWTTRVSRTMRTSGLVDSRVARTDELKANVLTRGVRRRLVGGTWCAFDDGMAVHALLELCAARRRFQCSLMKELELGVRNHAFGC